MKVTLDTETCGLYGVPVLLQYQLDNEPIVLYDLWKNPVGDTLDLFKFIAEQMVIGFNLAFDWFQIQKFFTMLDLFGKRSAIPMNYVKELAALEREARFGPCIKPASAFDLMLHARKGPYQSLMARKPIVIRRVPRALAWELAAELETRVKIEDIYFSRKKDKYAPRWVVKDVENQPEFKDVELKFHASGSLKTLAHHALGVQEDSILKFADVELDRQYLPNELGYAPFADAVEEKAWPIMLKYHVNHWAFNQLARKYATNDVVYTRGLYDYFEQPDPGDDDSILACCVASVRWRGYAVDIPRLIELRKECERRAASTPLAPRAVKAYLYEVLDDVEQLVIEEKGTSKVVLEDIVNNWEQTHPVVARIETVLGGRRAKKSIELIDKLLIAGRFHASYIVVGTKSTRMSGTDDLNPQAIQHSEEMRSCFLMADTDKDYTLCGGDFDGFEVGLAAAVYNDPVFYADLAIEPFHFIMCRLLHPGSDPAQVKSKEKDKWTKVKNCTFSMIFGGDASTFVRKYGISQEVADMAFIKLGSKYPRMAAERERIKNDFCPMFQEGGIGVGNIVWRDPADYVETTLGDRRYYTLENSICRALYDLAQKPPKKWNELKIKIIRRAEKGEQYVANAVRSAIFAAAFAVQGANYRSAGNHRIQAMGARITKHLQRRVWDHQPSGVGEFRVLPCNIHDELLCPCDRTHIPLVKATVQQVIGEYRTTVPLIGMEWKTSMKSWAEK